MRPFLTIGIPNYNYGRFLPDCIGSIVRLPDEDVEIVISDNASNDESWDVIRSYADSRIVSYRHVSTLPPVHNFNSVLERARGRYFKLLCSDDWIKPQLVDVLREFDSKAKGSTLSFFGHAVETLYGEPTEAVSETRETRDLWFNANSDMTSRWLCMNYSMPTMCVLSTQMAQGLGGYKLAAMRPDGILVSRLLTDPEFTCAGVTGESLACVRIHASNDRRNYTPFEAFRDEASFIQPFFHAAHCDPERGYFASLLRRAAANAFLGLAHGTLFGGRKYPILKALGELRQLDLLQQAILGIPAALLKAATR